jgi:alpha-tubulin suppressor-like RCC1 family protein
MGDQAVCYVGSDQELKCAGAVFSSVWGPEFTGTGEMNVDQVMIRPTFNAADGNGMCLLADGVVRCMGRNNNNGVYGTGGTADVPTLTLWGTVDDLVRIGTGTWDQICALDSAGDLYCSGYNYGPSPMLQASGISTFWVSTFGDVLTDDGGVWRVSQARAECQLRATGLACGGADYGPPGEIVDGGTVQGPMFDEAICWLTMAGDVQCSGAGQIEYFEEGRVLAIGLNYYTDSLCAVYDDGSLWCIGSNDSGKLGTGDYADVIVETEVQPAGSVRIECP